MLARRRAERTDDGIEQADFLTSRLTSLEERIDGVEDQLEIELDHRRNELVALDLIVGAVMGAFAFVSMIGGVFGMNMKNGYEDSKVSTLPACLATSICSCKVASHKMVQNGSDCNEYFEPCTGRFGELLSALVGWAQLRNAHCSEVQLAVQAAFYTTTVVTFLGAAGLLFSIVAFARWKRLLFIPEATNARPRP